MSEKSYAYDPARHDAARRILAAVDESENSKRAILAIADFFASDRDVFITVLSILPEPSEDFFATAAAREKWRKDKKAEMERVLAGYAEILRGAGFADSHIETRLVLRQCPSIADAILEEQEKQQCGLIVVGRRGLTHNEEFIFGSTSSRILHHHARRCAVLVVE